MQPPTTKTLLVYSGEGRVTSLLGALHRRGHDVREAAGVEEAVLALGADRFAMVFVDLVDPLECAVDVVRPLREAMPRGHGLLVGLSPCDGAEAVVPLLEAGVDDILDTAADGACLEARLAVLERRVQRAAPCDSSLAGCSEARVRDMLAELEVIHDSAAEGMLIVEVGTGRILRANRAAAQMLGYTEDELVRMRAAELHPADSHTELNLQMHSPAADGTVRASAVATLRKDGSVFIADISGRQTVYRDRPAVIGFFRDTTEQVRAARKLEESEQRYRFIADNLTDAIWTIDIAGINEALARLDEVPADKIAAELARSLRYTYVSPSIERITGYTVEEVMQRGPQTLLTPESFADAVAVLSEELAFEVEHPDHPYRQRVIEVRQVTKGGAVRWCEVTVRFLRDEAGAITGILGVTRDITQRREAERALRESEANFRGLFDNLPDFVVVVDSSATIQYANASNTNIPKQDLVGNRGFGFVKSEYREACAQAFRASLETGRRQTVDCIDIFGVRWACRLVPLMVDGAVRNVMIICSDITKRHKAEKAVRKEQKVLRQLLELHDRDRQVLAFELHDGFTQQLTGAALYIEAADTLAREAPAPVRESYTRGLRLLRDAIEEARRLVSGLCPPVLEEFGVVAGIEHLVGTSHRLGEAEVTFTCKGHFDRLAPSLENALFRIVQESISNAQRHSQSPAIRVELSRNRRRICLRVEDDGVGFDLKSVDESHFGLRGIRERVRLLGGTANIHSAPNKGTRITVHLPLIEAASATAIRADAHGGCSQQPPDGTAPA